MEVAVNNEHGIGITIKDVNLASGMTPSIFIKIQELLFKYKVVIFKRQQLNDQQLSHFAYHFGPPFIPDNRFPSLGSIDSVDPMVIVGNQANEYPNSYLGFQEVLAHSDHQWLQFPSAASLLYAIDVDERAAPTTWFDMVSAYNSLDDDFKKNIDDLLIITYNPFFRPFGEVELKYINRLADLPPGDTFPHPLIRTHPFTNEKILYFNLAYEIEFNNIEYEKGLEIFLKLSKHVNSLYNKYEHTWENGDLVIWDNRATIHYRPAFDSSIRRVLKRLSIAGEAPF